MLSFVWTWAFFLLPLPLLVYWLVPARKQHDSALYMPLLGARHINTTQHTARRPSRLWLMVKLIVWTCLVVAVARPVTIGEAVELPATGRDLMLAVDISESMRLEDMTVNGRDVNRLVMIKHVVKDFIEERRGDRLGLILFGSQAHIQAPLTFDLDTVASLLDETQIGFAGRATAIGDAIGLGIKRLANNPADSRVLILMTDGQNSAGETEPLEAAKLAKQENVIVYTIGVGSDKVRGGFFTSRSASADLDEATLKQIAKATGGTYFRARDKSDLAMIYATIDKLEAIDQDPEIYRPKRSLFHFPLGIGLALSLLGLLTQSAIHMKGRFA